MADIEIEYLRSVLTYNPDSGTLFWKARPDSMFPETAPGGSRGAAMSWNKRWANKPAMMTKHGNGYLCGTLCGRKLLAHRVAWAVFHGCWPTHEIDHINGEKTDNRITNLRDVEPAINQRNIGAQSNSKSGIRGVSWCKRDKRWIAYVGGRGRIGMFKTVEEAIAARDKAREGLGYIMLGAERLKAARARYLGRVEA